MRLNILFASVAFACGILFVNINNSIVHSVAWSSNIPDSIVITREYFKAVNPGDFFKIFSPATLLLALLSLVIYWKTFPNVRVLLALAFGCYVIADIFTFMYFHPRNDIMFISEPIPDVAILKKLASEWSSMNWIRSLIVLVGVIFSFSAIKKILSNRNEYSTSN